jgi:hypothetical protein
MAQSGYTPIKLYYSSTATSVPVNTNLANGELAINITDGKLYYKDNSGVVQLLSTKGGVGSSSTTQVLYNSSGLVVGSANLTFDGTKLSTNTQGIANYGDYTGISAPAYAEGRFWYDSTRKALTYYNDATSNAVHIGQETQIKVINNTGSSIPIGSPVYITGTSSGQSYPNIALAKADASSTSAVIGLTNTAIASGAIGYVTSNGAIDGISTSSYTVGQVLYLSPYSAGQLQNTVPPTGLIVQVGVVSYANASGSIYVKQTQPLSLATTQGGTGLTSYTAGDMVYYASGTAFTKLAIGTNGYVITSSGTAPQYTAQSSLSVGTATNIAGGAAGSVVYNSGAGATSFLAIGTANQVLTVNTGATAPQYVSQSTLSVGTATNIAGGVAGSVPYNTGAGATSFLSIGTAGQVLTVNSGGTAPQWAAPSGTTINALTIGTGLSGTSFNGSAAVTIAIDSTVATLTGTQTLTNKRINPRIYLASTVVTSFTPDISTYDNYEWTALSQNFTMNAPTGTPVDGNKIIFRLLDNGTSRGITWNATYVAIGVTLPATTTANKTTYVGCIYNVNNTRWDVVAVTTQA